MSARSIWARTSACEGAGSFVKPSLQVRLSQHLALTPQLQQSIRLLQLSTLELHQEVEQMLEANPFLEMDEERPLAEAGLADRAGATDRVSAPASDAEDRDGSPAADSDRGGDGDGAEPAIDKVDFDATERDDWQNGTEGEDFDGIRETPGKPSSNNDSDDGDPMERNSAGVSLQDFLREQLHGMRLNEEDAFLPSMALIESLTEDGYLADPLEEIAERLVRRGLGAGGRRKKLRCCRRRWSDQPALWRWAGCRTSSPLGVGARNLAECLVIQLKALEPE